jgi:HAD superfamily hydrolase (TIGR01549 family)
MPQIRLITFDLDNTLWDVHSVIMNAEATMRAWLVERVPEYARQIDTEQIQQIRNSAMAENSALAHDVSAMRKAVLKRAFSICGYSDSEARGLSQRAFDVFFEARQQVVFFPAALAVLEELAAEFRLGALTNGNADINAVGLGQYFSFAFSSADVGVSKPAPDMFHAALRHAGVAAADTIHVGDNLVDDIAGAAALGIHTIWTNHADHASVERSHEPTAIVNHLKDLPDAVEIIRGR